MNSFSQKLAVLLALVFSLQGTLACRPATAQDQCENLLATRCTRCHYLTRVCQMLGKKSARSWNRTIRNMVRYGTQLSTEEQQVLLDCLSDAAPGDKRVCQF